MNFRAIADTAFDDLLILRDATAAKQQDCQKEVLRSQAQLESNAEAVSEYQDLLVRLDILVRAEAMVRTQDIDCHLLQELKQNDALSRP